MFKAWHHSTERDVAVKIVPAEQDTGEVEREIDTLRRCDSPNNYETLDRPAGGVGSMPPNAQHAPLPGVQVGRRGTGTAHGWNDKHGATLGGIL